MKKNKKILVTISFIFFLATPSSNAAPTKKSKVAPSPTPVSTKAEPTATPMPSPEAIPTVTPVVQITPTPPPVETQSEMYGKKDRCLGEFVVGPYLTALSVPRPISFGVEAKWKDLVGLSGGYGLFPELKLDDVKLKITGYDFRLKFYPGKGAFFIGLGYGSQKFTGSSTQSISGAGPVTATVTQDNAFLAPQIGWNWTWDSGFFMGLDLGVQLSMNRTTEFTSEASQVVQATPDFVKLRKDVTDMAELIGKTPIPLLTLVKVGYFF